MTWKRQEKLGERTEWNEFDCGGYCCGVSATHPKSYQVPIVRGRGLSVAAQLAHRMIDDPNQFPIVLQRYLKHVEMDPLIVVQVSIAEDSCIGSTSATSDEMMECFRRPRTVTQDQAIQIGHHGERSSSSRVACSMMSWVHSCPFLLDNKN